MNDLPTPLHLLECWLVDLQADRADGTIKRYRGATWRFLSWYQQQEQQDLTLADLTPITRDSRYFGHLLRSKSATG